MQLRGVFAARDCDGEPGKVPQAAARVGRSGDTRDVGRKVAQSTPSHESSKHNVRHRIRLSTSQVF